MVSLIAGHGPSYLLKSTNIASALLNSTVTGMYRCFRKALLGYRFLMSLALGTSSPAEWAV